MNAISDDDDQTRGVTLPELIRRGILNALAEYVRVSIPCSVNRVATDGNGNITMVDCQPLIKDFHRDETGALVVEQVAIITNVPIGIPGGGGVRLTLPIERGDLGYLTFVDRSMDRWLSGSGGIVDPELYQRLALTDAVFTPGLKPFGAPWVNWPSDHATIGTDGADDGSHVKIHFRPSVVTIGAESGSKALALNGDGLTASSALATWAGVVETAINALAPGTFNAANQFAGVLVTNPGKAGNLGTVVGSATQAKGH